MKTLKHLSFAVLAMCFAACGGGDSTYEVTVDNTTIGGELSNYFSLEDKTYKYNYVEDWHDNVTVELKCIKPLPENLRAHIDVIVLDEDGTVISTSDSEYCWDNNFDDILQQASPGEIVTVKITNEDSQKFSDPAKIRLSSTVKEIEEPTYSSDSPDIPDDADSFPDDGEDITEADDIADSSASPSSSSQDWDAMLDSYEKYVDKYISFMKRAANGDLTALAEYPALLSQAQEYSDKIQAARGSMSASQLARYTRITTKMLNAAQ